MPRSDLLSECMTSPGDDFECPRDHTGMEGGILMLQLAEIRTPICLRCLANMLRCCEAVPKQDKQEEAVTNGNQTQGKEPSAEEG